MKKFYVFEKGYEYFAMIYASSEEEAIRGYRLEVSDIDDEKTSRPTEVDKKQALELWKKGYTKDSVKTEKEKEAEFEEALQAYTEENYLIVLIDSRLNF